MPLHDAHAEGEGNNLLPIVEKVEEDVSAGPGTKPVQYREVACKPDGESWKNDVKADVARAHNISRAHLVTAFPAAQFGPLWPMIE